MKKLLGVVLILIGLGMAFSFYSDGNWNPFQRFAWGAEAVKQERSVSASGVERVRVLAESANVTVAPSDSSQIRAYVTGQMRGQIEKDLQFEVEKSGDTVIIQLTTDNRFGFGFNQLNLTVELPEKQWSSAEVKAKSGNVNVRQLSGDQLQLQTSSGNIAAEQLTSKTIKLEASSGNVRLQGFQAEQVRFETSSGNTMLLEGTGEIKGESRTGNVSIHLPELTRNLDLSARSGDVKVTLDQEPKSFAVDFSAGSGRGDIAWEGVRYEVNNEERSTMKGKIGEGETLVKVRTRSGNFMFGPN